MRAGLVFLLALQALSYCDSSGARDSQLSGEALRRLQEGEVLLENTRTDESGGAARVRALMHATAEQVWQVLLACEQTFRYVDGLRSCEVLEGDRQRKLVRQSVKKSWLVPRLDYTVEFLYQPYTRIDFQKTEGDLELLEGNWLFEEMPKGHGLLVTHNIRVRPRVPAPRWLIRRSIRRDIPDMLACVRFLAGGSGNKRQLAVDRDRCPRPRHSRNRGEE